jgi:hypothetical protein
MVDLTQLDETVNIVTDENGTQYARVPIDVWNDLRAEWTSKDREYQRLLYLLNTRIDFSSENWLEEADRVHKEIMALNVTRNAKLLATLKQLSEWPKEEGDEEFWEEFRRENRENRQAAINKKGFTDDEAEE